MIEKLITILFPIYGIFMFFVRDDSFQLLQYAIASLLCYLVLIVEIELGFAGFATLLILIFIDYVAN